MKVKKESNIPKRRKKLKYEFKIRTNGVINAIPKKNGNISDSKVTPSPPKKITKKPCLIGPDSSPRNIY